MPRLIHALGLSSLLILVLLAGCGQSGPLYLPGNPSKVTTIPPENADEEQTEDDENGNRRDDE